MRAAQALVAPSVSGYREIRGRCLAVAQAARLWASTARLTQRRVADGRRRRLPWGRYVAA